MPGRVAVFNDLINQYVSLQNIWPGFRVNYSAYLPTAVGDQTLVRAHAYSAQKCNEAAKFSIHLKSLGYEVYFRSAIIRNGKANISMTELASNLITDAIALWWEEGYDTIIIGSSDEKLLPMVKYLKSKTVKIVVYTVEFSNRLLRAADEVKFIDESVIERRKIYISANNPK